MSDTDWTALTVALIPDDKLRYVLARTMKELAQARAQLSMVKYDAQAILRRLS